MSNATPSAVDMADIFTLAQARRVAAMLDIDPQQLRQGDPVPRGWHFAMLAGQSPRHALRPDGFPGLGIPMPRTDRPRLLLGERSMAFRGNLVVGAPLRRQSAIASIVEKTGRNGPLSIVRVEHVLSGDADAPDGAASITESQTYYLAGPPSSPGTATATRPGRAAPDVPAAGASKVVTPDEVLLFQYSALGFNTHRIHFDRDYATRVEGHPDLVVNGGLATLLATEYLRNDLGRPVSTLSARHLAPLYVNRPLTIRPSELSDAGASLSLIDCDGRVAAELVVTFDEL